VYLPKELYDKVAEVAKIEGVSVGRVVRQVVEGIAGEPAAKRKYSAVVEWLSKKGDTA